MFSKATWAKMAGWGQLAVVYANQLFDGKPIPSTRTGWLALVASFLAGLAVHHASGTDGAK